MDPMRIVNFVFWMVNGRLLPSVTLNDFNVCDNLSIYNHTLDKVCQKIWKTYMRCSYTITKKNWTNKTNNKSIYLLSLNYKLNKISFWKSCVCTMLFQYTHSHLHVSVVYWLNDVDEWNFEIKLSFDNFLSNCKRLKFPDMRFYIIHECHSSSQSTKHHEIRATCMNYLIRMDRTIQTIKITYRALGAVYLSWNQSTNPFKSFSRAFDIAKALNDHRVLRIHHKCSKNLLSFNRKCIPNAFA